MNKEEHRQLFENILYREAGYLKNTSHSEWNMMDRVAALLQYNLFCIVYNDLKLITH